MEESTKIRRRRGAMGAMGSDMVNSCVEAVTRFTDTAERVVETATDWDPRYGARNAADVVRETPKMMDRIAYALNDGLRDVNETLTDMMDMRRWDRSRGPVRPTGRSEEVETPSEEDIVAESRAYIGRGRYQGATLDGLIRHLSGIRGYSETQLEAIIGRHFLIDGGIVLPAASVGAADLPESVEEHLRALGYSDIRRKVPLARLGDAPAADLVAYAGGKPTILVMRVTPGRMNDPQSLEDARFQAMTLDAKATPAFIYLTDGRVNRYFSVDDDRIVTELPRQPATA